MWLHVSKELRREDKTFESYLDYVIITSKKENILRIDQKQHQAIKKYFLEVFKEGHIYLFGSRTDDTKRGGDIDLYIQTLNREKLVHKKLDFLMKLKRVIGNQKIDVVFDKGLQRSIDKVAQSEGILL